MKKKNCTKWSDWPNNQVCFASFYGADWIQNKCHSVLERDKILKKVCHWTKYVAYWCIIVSCSYLKPARLHCRKVCMCMSVCKNNFYLPFLYHVALNKQCSGLVYSVAPSEMQNNNWNKFYLLLFTSACCLIKVSDEKKIPKEKMLLCTESCYIHDCWNNTIMVLILYLLQLKTPLVL